MELRKAALLLDKMGEIGMDVFDSWDEEVEDILYEDMKERFELHFTRKENIIATRHRFLSIEMEAGETMDGYVERIDRSSRSCRFGDLREAMVVHMVIKGMKEDKLRKELLLKKGLNLDMVRERCRQFESAMAASRIITKGGPVQEVEAIAREQEGEVNWVGSRRGRGQGAPSSRGKGGATGSACYTCNGFGHFARNCPSQRERQGGGAKEDKRGCYTCGDKSHFAWECPKSRGRAKQQRKAVNNVEEGEHSDTSNSSL